MIGAPRGIALANAAQRDRFFPSVSLLLHCDGTNGSTSFTDSGPKGISFTSNGGAQVSTAAPKFGTGSMLLNGSGQWVSFPNTSELNLGSGDWTLEMWVKMAAGFTNYKRLFSFCAASPASPSDESILIEVTQTTGTLGVYAGIGAAWTTAFDTVAITTGSWVHVAAVRSGSTLYLWKNGTLAASSAISGSINFNAAWTGYIGRWPASSLRDFNGEIDEVRFTKGVARYTSAFTPPALPFPNF